MKKIILIYLLAVSYTLLAANVSFTENERCQDILKRINQYRIMHHKNPLIMNAQISLEATQHSIEMANHTLPFGHQGFSNRIKRLIKKIPTATAGAENIAFNYSRTDILVDGWTHSRGHQQNILGSYRLTGIGIAKDSKGRIYYTQIFIR